MRCAESCRRRRATLAWGLRLRSASRSICRRCDGLPDRSRSTRRGPEAEAEDEEGPSEALVRGRCCCRCCSCCDRVKSAGEAEKVTLLLLRLLAIRLGVFDGDVNGR